MFKVNKVLFTLALSTFFTSVSATDVNVSVKTENNFAFQTIKYQRDLAWALAPIKSSAELESLALVNSPLDFLSAGAKERFINSVQFRDNGIAGFYYADLEAELSPTQIHQILTLIGAQHTVGLFKGARVDTKQDLLLLSQPIISNHNVNISPLAAFADHIDKYCDEPHTCREETGAVCMTGC